MFLALARVSPSWCRFRMVGSPLLLFSRKDSQQQQSKHKIRAPFVRVAFFARSFLRCWLLHSRGGLLARPLTQKCQRVRALRTIFVCSSARIVSTSRSYRIPNCDSFCIESRGTWRLCHRFLRPQLHATNPALTRSVS